MDRRLFTRIEIPEAKIQIKRSGKNGFFSNLSKPTSILNLSKSGLALNMDRQMAYGDIIQMKLSFPDGKRIHIKGQVRWQNSGAGLEEYSAGVQFSPFGSRNDYNPVSALKYLRSIEGLGQVKINPDQTASLD